MFRPTFLVAGLALVLPTVSRADKLSNEHQATCVAFLPGGRDVIYGTVGGDVWIGGKKSRLLHESLGSVASLAVSKDGKIAAWSIHGKEDAVVVWDLARDRVLTRVLLHADSVAFSPDGKYLAVGGDSVGHLYHARTGEAVRSVSTAFAAFIRLNREVGFLAFSQDGRQLALCGRSELGFYDLASGKLVRETRGVGGFTQGFGLSSDARRVAATGSSSTRVAGERGNTRLVTLEGDTLVYRRGEFRVWELATGRELLSIAGTDSEASCAVFTPSGRSAAFVDGNTIKVWDVTSGECTQSLTGSGVWVSGLAVSDDGKLLASAGSGGVKLWDLEEDRPNKQKKEISSLFNDLHSRDAKAAIQAVFALANDPKLSIPLLREKLLPARSVPEDDLARLVADLESDHFAVRQKATTDLEKLERLAAPVLQNLLANRPPLEVRRRAEHLLAQLEEPNLSGEILRGIRAVEVLERIDSSESRRLLKALAEGAPEARLTQEAKAALEREPRGFRR